MDKLKELSIGAKLVLMTVVLVLVAILATSIIGYSLSRSAIERNIFNQLGMARQLRASEIEGFFKQQQSLLSVLAGDVLTIETIDSSTYSNVHAKYHPMLRNIMQKNGWRDLYIVDTSADTVIYSVEKRIDFGTSLENGPFKDSGLAKAYHLAKNAKQGVVSMADFESYIPADGAQALFMATPIYFENSLKGVIIIQITSDEINRVMTGEQKWASIGFGNSGETYLIGSNGTLRSETRTMIEDKKSYLSFLAAQGVDAKTTRQIEMFNYGIGLHSINTNSAQLATKGQKGEAIVKGYQNDDVFSSYGKLDIPGLDWYIICEISLAEAMEPAHNLRNAFIFSSLLIALIASAVLHLFSSRVIV
ncbi:MAG TPA: cache domain-containing protein, partial [Pseudomonadales bacterium]|nr:cache domain-containing protein [Pseudomonadales bacterium]